MSRLNEVLKELGAIKENTSKESKLPVSRIQLLQLDAAMSSIFDGSAQVKPEEALAGILENPSLFTKLSKAETKEEAIDAIIGYLETVLEDYDKNPDDFNAELDTTRIKSLVDRYKEDRMATDREQEAKDKTKEQEEADKETDKAVKDAEKEDAGVPDATKKNQDVTNEK